MVPQLASVWYYFRELDQPHMKELYELGDTMAEAAAAMTSTKASWRILEQLGIEYPTVRENVGHAPRAALRAAVPV